MHRLHGRVPCPGLLSVALVAVLTAVFVVSAGAGPATVPDGFEDDLIHDDLDEPLSLARVPDVDPAQPRVLFVEQHTARIGLVIGRRVRKVGTVPGIELTGNERGLLGIVVDPRWPAKPYVYIHAADNRSGNHIAISRFTLVGDIGYTGTGMLQLDVTSRRDLLLLPDDHPFHNGGTVRFGPDQRLYVSLGDDWFSCQAQDPNVAAGKILRLDVSRLPPGPGGPGPFALLTPSDNPYAAAPDSMARMMWIIGLRNPFRFHIDPATGDLFVADVGQETWEEVERFTAGGQNGGWPWREGGVSYTTCTGSPPAAIEPIAVYGHGEGVAIMSGGVYRGTARGALNFPAEYEGNYFFHDYFTGIMRRLVGSGSSWDPAPEVPGQPTSTDWATGMNEVTDVLEMPDGSLWYCRRSVDGEPESGEIRRIGHPNPNTPPPPPPAAVPVSLQLAVPQPTPSYGSVTLSWSQPRNGEARLVVYDIRGRVMRVLEDGVPFTPGTHASEWDGRDGAGTAVAPGLYLVQLTVGAESRRTRITLLR